MKKLIAAVILMTGLLWAEEVKVTVGHRFEDSTSHFHDFVITPCGWDAQNIYFVEIAPVNKDIVKVVYRAKVDQYDTCNFTEYLKRGDRFYQDSHDSCITYTIKDFGYNYIKFDKHNESCDFKETQPDY